MADYGDQRRQTDEYGNPVRHGVGAGTGGANMGVGGVGANKGGQQYGTTGGFGGDTLDTGMAGQQHGQLRRSGSSSSSSSEDDGMGGRRKKGIKEKIREKLPGGHKDAQETGYEHGGTGTGTGYGTGTGTGTGYGQQEKKGMMEKIKEKLPGGGS